MGESIEQQRARFENSLNSGDLTTALDALERLKKANCDIRLTLRPEGGSFSQDPSLQQRVQYLERLGLSPQQAVDIAERTPSNEAAHQMAIQRGLVR